MKRKAVTLLNEAFRARPDFLIIGTQKAGTTSLDVYLREHSQISPARKKEIHFFNLYYDRGFAWYLSHFPWGFKARGKLVYEATPDYLCHEVVPQRIKNHLGRVKMIAVLREPAARAWSSWKMWHSFADRPELGKTQKADMRSFTEAIDEELACPNLQQHLHFHYVRMGCYARHIQRYHDCFPKEDILVLDYAEMGENLSVFLARICDFLGIERFNEEQVKTFSEQRHWISPKIAMTKSDAAALESLRQYFRPLNLELFALLNRSFNW